MRRFRATAPSLETGERTVKKVLNHLEGGKTKARHAFIQQVKEKEQIGRLCQWFDVSKSGYYAWLNRQEIDKDKADKRLVIKVYKK